VKSCAVGEGSSPSAGVLLASRSVPMAPHRRAFSRAALITLQPSGANLMSRGDGQAESLATEKSGRLFA
jgi:hypothetical protein